MNYEQIKEFLTIPELPDVISYLLFLVVVITIEFVKAYVKRDNRRTMNQVNSQVDELNKTKAEFEKDKEEFAKEVKEFKKEKKSLQSDINKLKKAVLESSGNTRELVAKGTANKIAKELTEESQVVEEEKKDE